MTYVQFLKLVKGELTDRDIFNVRESNNKVKYLCLQNNKLNKPWQLLAIRCPYARNLDVKGNNRE